MTGWPANWLSSRRIAAAVVLGLTFWLIRSFMIPLIWAGVFAIANWPLYRRCAKHVPEAMREQVLPMTFSILLSFFVLGPVVFAFAILARQSQAWLTEISIMDKGGLLAPSWLRATPMVGTRLADAWNDAAGTPGGLSVLLSRVEDSSLLHSLQSVGHLIAYHAFVVAITVVALVFLFRRPMIVAVGKAMLDEWLTYLRPEQTDSSGAAGDAPAEQKVNCVPII